MSFSYFFTQSDPACNRQVTRRWREQPLSPAEIDRLADRELQHGHPSTAEQLAWLAASIREAQP